MAPSFAVGRGGSAAPGRQLDIGVWLLHAGVEQTAGRDFVLSRGSAFEDLARTELAPGRSNVGLVPLNPELAEIGDRVPESGAPLEGGLVSTRHHRRCWSASTGPCGASSFRTTG